MIVFPGTFKPADARPLAQFPFRRAGRAGRLNIIHFVLPKKDTAPPGETCFSLAGIRSFLPVGIRNGRQRDSIPGGFCERGAFNKGRQTPCVSYHIAPNLSTFSRKTRGKRVPQKSPAGLEISGFLRKRCPVDVAQCPAMSGSDAVCFLCRRTEGRNGP